MIHVKKKKEMAAWDYWIFIYSVTNTLCFYTLGKFFCVYWTVLIFQVNYVVQEIFFEY